MSEAQKDDDWTVVDASDSADWSLVNGAKQTALMVLVCGVPGCGKDALGRACAKHLSNAACVSQDEHGGSGDRTWNAVESLLQSGRSPIFILRNCPSAADRAGWIEVARTYNYRTAAIWPSEIRKGEPFRRAAFFMAALSGCYGRLSDGGKAGHETLVVKDGKMCHPADICHDFLRNFRIPSAPGEVDATLSLCYLQKDIQDVDLLDGRESRNCIATLQSQMDTHRMPPLVEALTSGPFQKVQSELASFAGNRRDLEEVVAEMLAWIKEQESILAVFKDGVPSAGYPVVASAAGPSKVERKQLQREVSIRAAIEHLVSPANIASCRAQGSTVKNCIWIATEPGQPQTRPAWPTSHFCGAPQLKKLGAKDAEIIQAARQSMASIDSLQEGKDGVRIEVIGHQKGGNGILLSPADRLPDDCLKKLGCPGLS